MPSGSNTTVASTANGSPDASANGSNSNAILKTQTSHDHTSYVARARITRAAPPKPATNPLQFIQTKPIFKGVKEPVKRVEEVKKVKEVIKEEPEDWQSNLDNWKVGRRKRVEHIIERVVEVKKLELEEHDRTRRKSKTFAELMEERGSKGRKVSLAIYNEDDANDLSDLGIGTSSASGKSSLSEDYDNHSVISDNQDIEKLHHSSDVDNNSNPEHHHHLGVNADRDYISSPGYDTSSSTAPASSPDLGEYNYESSVHEYKSCGPRALPGGTNFYGSSSTSSLSKDSTPERSLDHVPQPPAHHVAIAPAAKRPSLTKIENRLLNFEIKGTSQEEKVVSLAKKDLPKVDVLKRREMFEKEASIEKPVETSDRRLSADFSKGVSSIKERMSNLEKREEVKDAAVKKLNRMSGDFGSVKERLTTIEKPMEVLVPEKKMPIEVPAVSIKDRLSSLHAAPAVTPKKIVNVIDETPVESAAPTDVVEPHHQESSFADDSGIQTEETTYIHEVSMESVNLVQQLINDLVIHEPVVEVMAPAAVPDVIPVAFTEKPQPAARKETTPVLPRTHEVLNLPDYDNESMFNTPEPNSLEQESSVIEALELAFKAIDTETPEHDVDAFFDITPIEKSPPKPTVEPIYENVDEIQELYAELEQDEQATRPSPIPQPNATPDAAEEPHYEVLKPSAPPPEPYYQVPNPKPVPLYENIEIVYTANNQKYPGVASPIGPSTQTLEPPKEKPPPPPADASTDEEDDEHDDHEDDMGHNGDYEEEPELQIQDPMKRMNSTRRIKKEIRNKRTSFLGIESVGDEDSYLELSAVIPPPNMTALIQEELRLEKQMYIKASGRYDSSDTTESPDSGVSENHSRQSSEPITTSSEPDDYIAKKEQEIIEVLEHEERRRSGLVGDCDEPDSNGWEFNDSFRSENEIISNRLNEEARMRCLEDQIREQEEVLKVERELLQLEQEELKRQRENLMHREHMARRELDHGSKMLQTTTSNRHSMQDINATNLYANVPNQHYMPQPPLYQHVTNEYRKSMPNLLQDMPFSVQHPPAKPMRSHLSQDLLLTPMRSVIPLEISHNRNHSAPIKPAQSIDDFVQMRHNTNGAHHHQQQQQQPSNPSSAYANMTKHTLHALSATPKPKFQDAWVQQNRHSTHRQPDWKEQPRVTDAWLTVQQQKRRSEPAPAAFNYNQHWLIQEAEQRRIDQLRGIRTSTTTTHNHHQVAPAPIQRNGSSDNKPLPDAVIQTLTQRVHSRGLGKKYESHPAMIGACDPIVTSINSTSNIPFDSSAGKEVLSVSGKKKCSYCSEELGRGAAMIIESLRLFYHLDCFKCCVCRVQLGDGVSGADVRVRNQKLHCHNCFSSDDGIKFSCV